jgi:hypothetical protein
MPYYLHFPTRIFFHTALIFQLHTVQNFYVHKLFQYSPLGIF